jgi:hypothetical protein
VEEQEWRPIAADPREYFGIAGLEAQFAGIGEERAHAPNSRSDEGSIAIGDGRR